jgi:hypothetical protein
MKSNKIPSYLLYKRILAEGQKLVTLESENFLVIIRRFAWKISELIIHRDKKVTSKMKVFFRLANYLVVLNKRHGSLFVCKYLKASLLSIQRAIAGSPMKSLREIEPDLPLPRLSRSGLPGWIGTRDRRAILSHSLSVTQFYLTLFSLYRVVDCPVKAKIQTITDPFNGNAEFLEQSLGYFVNFHKNLIRYIPKKPPVTHFLAAKLLFLQTSSPSQAPWSWYGWGWDASLIAMRPGMRALFGKWLELTENWKLRGMIWTVPRRNTKAMFEGLPHHRCLTTEVGVWSLGRLAFKKEAAGKLRVFAMVDVWTQSIFKPLHDYLFKILTALPNDATFDQGAAFKRAVSKSKDSGHCFGFDLSAATDRLPIDLQRAILEGLIGKHLASLWHLILIERDYVIPKNDFQVPEGSVRYAVGQPMGALSSWAMLALCHHAIVQYAFRLIGGSGWCLDYEVLGDDIVIFSPSLAAKYIELMSLYGVELNMAKSVISIREDPVVEFAKRTSLKGSDVSPLSMKMFLNQDHFKGRVSIFMWWKDRIKDHFIPAFKTIMKSVRWDDRPGNDKISLLSLLSSLVSQGKVPVVWIYKELKNSRALIQRKGKMMFIKFPGTWGFQLAKAVLEGQEDLSKFEPRSTHSYMFEERWYKVAIITRINQIIAKWLAIGQVAHKDAVLDRVVVRKGTHWSKFWKLLDDHLNSVLSRPWLTLMFYQKMDLSKYSLEYLLKFLDEVEGAASILELPYKTKVTKKVMKENLRAIQFIEKSMKKKVRENEKLALQSSWTQIRTQAETSAMEAEVKWVKKPGLPGSLLLGD